MIGDGRVDLLLGSLFGLIVSHQLSGLWVTIYIPFFIEYPALFVDSSIVSHLIDLPVNQSSMEKMRRDEPGSEV